MLSTHTAVTALYGKVENRLFAAYYHSRAAVSYTECSSLVVGGKKKVSKQFWTLLKSISTLWDYFA